MDLSFNEAAKGANKSLKIDIMDTCDRCNGKGNEPGSKVSKCGYCGGTGTVKSLSLLEVRAACCRCSVSDSKL